MSELQEFIDEQLKADEEFAQDWAAHQSDYEIMKLIVDARNEEGLTQKELAERCGLKASNLSRLENGKSSPTVKTLRALAAGLGKHLEIRFV